MSTIRPIRVIIKALLQLFLTLLTSTITSTTPNITLVTSFILLLPQPLAYFSATPAQRLSSHLILFKCLIIVTHLNTVASEPGSLKGLPPPPPAYRGPPSQKSYKRPVLVPISAFSGKKYAKV